MKNRVLFFIAFTLFWFFYFILCKLIFLIYHYSLSFQLPFKDWLLILFYGSKLDISTTGYILVIPGLLLTISPYFKTLFLFRFIKVYTIVLLSIASLITVADMELYRHWGFRMDSTPLMYLKTPKEAVASLDLLNTLLQVLIIIIIIFSGYFGYKKIIEKRTLAIKPDRWPVSVYFLFITGSLILPVRGGIGIAPINVGFVYFHERSIFANHAAINVLWNVGQSLTKLDETKPSVFFDDTKAKLIFNDLYKDNGKTHHLLKLKHPNILLLILESYTAKIIEPLGGTKGVTPNFNKYCKEGVLFTNFYASGDRTDKGILAILNGYPAQTTTSIVNFANKTEHLPFLNKSLKELGYHSEWIFGYDIDFANFRSYFMNARYDKVFGKENFPSSTYNSKWGVHDHIVFDSLLNECNKIGQPFFVAGISLSSHEPFDVPIKTAIQGSDEEHRFLNSAYYTDQSLGILIEKAKKTKWWDSTLIILVADHGSRHPHNTPNYALKKFQIPMLWIGGALTKKDTIIKTFATQTDISRTILEQVGGGSKEFIFSQNILSSNPPNFAYYSFNNGFGFVQDSVKLIYDNIARIYILEEGQKSENSLDIGKAYLQVLMNDFLKR